MTDRTLTYLPLADLKADPLNPKAHDLGLIGESVSRFGYIEPIVRDDRTGYLISGHGRTASLLAAQNSGETPPEGVRIGVGGQWLIPVVTGWSSRNDAEARGALIALNRTGELGGWTDDALLTLLDSLSATDEAFLGVGFDGNDLDDLRARLAEVEGADPRDYQGTRETPSMGDYAEKYEEQGRRLIVLDYDQEQYTDITARLRVLRERTGLDSNADAVLAYLAETVPLPEPEDAEAVA